MTLSPQRLEKAAREISNLAWRLEGSPGDNGYYAMQRRAAIKKAREIISAYLGDTRVDVPRELTKETLDRAVAFALTVTIGGKYNWSAYMADLYRLMLSAELTERDAG